MSVCVVGAGFSGLCSIKSAREAGFQVTCFEKELNVAGRWHSENKHAIPRNTVTNLPTHFSCFSDFPMPENYPLYLSAEMYAQYFDMYAENFSLKEHIKFGCKILSIKPLWQAKETESVGHCRWSIVYENKGIRCVEDFDFVVVCSGFYSKPYIPDAIQKNIEMFNGKVMHCIDYKSAEDFKDQNVVVCGLGNSGGI